MSEHAIINLSKVRPTGWHRAAVSTMGRRQDRNGLIALVLEDEPLISIDVETMLDEAGFDVVYVMSCKEAHAWLDLHCPDVVVVDIELRDGPCTAVVERLVHSSIPFIIHSGHHPDMHEDTPFMRGPWVCKPALTDALIQAARAAVAGSSFVPDRLM